MDRIVVSVIIPSYKPGTYFEDCIKSISNQSFDKTLYEVIVVLNGDLSYNTYVQSIINKYSDVACLLYYATDIASVSNARNVGIDNSRGEYVLFMDDDDVVSSGFIESILSVSTPVCIGVSCTKLFKENIETAYINSFIFQKEEAFKSPFSLFWNRKCLSGPCGKCISKSIIGESRFDTRFLLGEDNLFWLLISHKIINMRLASDACYYIRIRPNSLTRSRYSNKYLVTVTLNRNIEIVKIFFQHPLKNNILLFAAKLLSSTRNGFRMIKISVLCR